jgi:hypothetical protein
MEFSPPPSSKTHEERVDDLAQFWSGVSDVDMKMLVLETSKGIALCARLISAKSYKGLGHVCWGCEIKAVNSCALMFFSSSLHSYKFLFLQKSLCREPCSFLLRPFPLQK